MPELPEIEHLKRTLEPRILGLRIERVALKRRDVVRNEPLPARSDRSARLLRGQQIVRLARRGKQLAIIGSGGSVLCVHLGMSGQLRFMKHGDRLPRSDHVHCIWHLRGPGTQGRLVFRDPRRFGGLWVFGSEEDLLSIRWSTLGPDAMTIRSTILARALSKTRQSIKAALLDQSTIAGIGNIYADEALYMSGIHPQKPANELAASEIARLAAAIRMVLRRAIKAGGSTLRDYSDASGTAGWFQVSHAVYGRAGCSCRRCDKRLVRILVAQRSTTFCPQCQPQPKPLIHNPSLINGHANRYPNRGSEQMAPSQIRLSKRETHNTI